MDLDQKLGVARKTELLAALPEPVLRGLLEESRELVLDPNEILFEEGAAGKTMYLVLEGELEVYKGDRRIALGGPGQCFGEMALIDGKERAASLRATTRTLLLEVSGEQFQETIAGNPAALMILARTISVPTSSAPDGNDIPVPKPDADAAMDAAACIGCGACVAACPNASAMLFTAAKASHLGLLPQGQPERYARARKMVAAMDEAGFGACTNHGECEAACPKQIRVEFIARLNRDYIVGWLKARQEARSHGGAG